MFFYNNTILTETSAGSSSNVHWRNNLMLPQNAASRGVAAVDANRPNTPELEQRKYATLADYMRESKQDQHSVVLDWPGSGSWCARDRPASARLRPAPTLMP